MRALAVPIPYTSRPRLLEEDVNERPVATVSDRRRFLERLMGEPLSDSTVRRL